MMEAMLSSWKSRSNKNMKSMYNSSWKAVDEDG